LTIGFGLTVLIFAFVWTRSVNAVEGHRHQGHGFLLPDREQLVELAVARLRAQALGAGDQLVGESRPRGEHDDELGAVRAGGLDPLGHLLDPFDVAD